METMSKKVSVWLWLNRYLTSFQLALYDFMIMPLASLTLYGNVKIFDDGRLISCLDGQTDIPFSFTTGIFNRLTFESTAKYILIVESKSFIEQIQTLLKSDKDSLIIALGAGPSFSDRLLLKTIQECLQVPIYVLTDLDLGGFKKFTILKYGSKINAHLNRRLKLNNRYTSYRYNKRGCAMVND